MRQIASLMTYLDTWNTPQSLISYRFKLKLTFFLNQSRQKYTECLYTKFNIKHSYQSLMCNHEQQQKSTESSWALQESKMHTFSRI